MPDLLIELLSEEIPARMQARAAEDLKRLVTEGLVQAGLTYRSAGAFATPRRLALSVEGLTGESRPSREERKGPRVDAPEAALQGFLRSTGLTREQLEARETPKGAVWFAALTRPGRKAPEIVAEVLEATIRGFPWPKSMRWGSGRLLWVRPLQSILCLLSDTGGAEVVPLSIEGLSAGNTTRGHRFMAPAPFAVNGFEDYRHKLARAFVRLDAHERAEVIRSEAANAAFAQSLEVVPDEALLAEIAGLVEWPVVLTGRIAERFLSLPPEVLQTSMRAHQKFLSLRNPASGRIEGFVTVANRETADDGAAILAGNRKVLAARLSDAAFFWEGDLREARAGMTHWAEGLKSVTFHNKLGSQADRVARIAALARELAPAVGADPDRAARAAQLAKLDLRSAMVGEFPDLQGTMGRYYALATGEPVDVADAVRDHWSPKGESDTVPSAPVSVAVALADKLDTLTGFWAIDEKPTGSKDPFALRRAALGAIRILLARNARLRLNDLCQNAVIELALQKHANFCGLVETSDPNSDAIRYYDSQTQTLYHPSTPHHNIDALLAKGQFAFHSRGFAAASEMLSSDEVSVLQLDLLCTSLLAFLHERLKVHLREQGIRHDVIDAVLALPGNDDLVLVVKRAEALSAFLKTADGENLLQGFRRANNILTQAEAADGVEYAFGADAKFAADPGEAALFAALAAAEPAIRAALAAEDFAAAMTALAALRAPLDAFFEAVQINSDNATLRRNRLNLLSQFRVLCLSVADLGRIAG